MRLSKHQYKKCTGELRDLWCRWDPIGVTSMPDWPRDEYDAYLAPTLRLLESGASLQKIISYLMGVELDRMGLSETPKARSKRRAFAADLREWYETRWASTSV
jgi:hypothetical protein